MQPVHPPSAPTEESQDPELHRGEGTLVGPSSPTHRNIIILRTG
ncbi:hypothetical protein [Pasteuria penetrans]|nr:hypothetical protein [Pasteuria penetrans]